MAERTQKYPRTDLIKLLLSGKWGGAPVPPYTKVFVELNKAAGIVKFTSRPPKCWSAQCRRAFLPPPQRHIVDREIPVPIHIVVPGQ